MNNDQPSGQRAIKGMDNDRDSKSRAIEIPIGINFREFVYYWWGILSQNP